MTQLTREQAVEFNESGAWRQMTAVDKARFQLEQEMVCMPIFEFHASLEFALGRSVFTHEFSHNDKLLAELVAKHG